MTTTTSVGQAANDTAASGTLLQLTRIWDQYGMLVIFAILFLLACVLVPNFASLINMRGLGLAVSMSGMVACGMLFCLASGEFDMSVGSVVACSGVACAVGINATESIPQISKMWANANTKLGRATAMSGLPVRHRIRVAAPKTNAPTIKTLLPFSSKPERPPLR